MTRRLSQKYNFSHKKYSTFTRENGLVTHEKFAFYTRKLGFLRAKVLNLFTHYLCIIITRYHTSF